MAWRRRRLRSLLFVEASPKEKTFRGVIGQRTVLDIIDEVIKVHELLVKIGDVIDDTGAAHRIAVASSVANLLAALHAPQARARPIEIVEHVLIAQRQEVLHSAGIGPAMDNSSGAGAGAAPAPPGLGGGGYCWYLPFPEDWSGQCHGLPGVQAALEDTPGGVAPTPAGRSTTGALEPDGTVLCVCIVASVHCVCTVFVCLHRQCGFVFAFAFAVVLAFMCR